MLIVTFGVIALICSQAHAASNYQPGKTFTGDGTYYGDNTVDMFGIGNCAIRAPRPSFYSSLTPVAINGPQYNGLCGACIEYWGNGVGSGANPILGRHKAMITDRCPECKFGDIDLGIKGDGRWKVSWKIVPCQTDSKVSFQFEGSNLHYWKLQPRGLKSPPVKVTMDGVKAEYTQDNHWVVHKSFKVPVKVVVDTALGEHVESYLSKWVGVVYGGSISGGGGGGDDNDNQNTDSNQSSDSDDDKPSGGQCVQKWHACTGPKNKLSTSKCCDGWSCVTASKKRFVGKRCEPS